MVGTEPKWGWGWGICSIKPHVNHVGLSYCLTPIGLVATIKFISTAWVTKPWLSQPVQLTRISEPVCLLRPPLSLPTEIFGGSKSAIQHASSPSERLCDRQATNVLQIIIHFKTFSRQVGPQKPAQGFQDAPSPRLDSHHYPALLNTILPTLIVQSTFLHLSHKDITTNFT